MMIMMYHNTIKIVEIEVIIIGMKNVIVIVAIVDFTIEIFFEEFKTLQIINKTFYIH